MVEIDSKELVKRFFKNESERPKIIKTDLENFTKSVMTTGKISKTQVRKHYNYFLNVYQEAIAENDFKDDHALRLAMEKVYLTYDISRKKVNPPFRDFVVSLIREIKDLETLKLGKKLFEGFVGYSKFYGKEE